jgi:hypothetical protein
MLRQLERVTEIIRFSKLGTFERGAEIRNEMEGAHHLPVYFRQPCE